MKETSKYLSFPDEFHKTILVQYLVFIAKRNKMNL